MQCKIGPILAFLPACSYAAPTRVAKVVQIDERQRTVDFRELASTLLAPTASYEQRLGRNAPQTEASMTQSVSNTTGAVGGPRIFLPSNVFHSQAARCGAASRYGTQQE